ncbi:MAG TPA: purine-nucleoside phosphorylase [Campylobacterales bacterium]|nr:purine-nucleoside phosphorylase [Campylobacterales bacterium]
MFICAGESETFDFAKPMGVGMIDMTMNLTKLCIKNPPPFIFFVGTAGSYGKHNIFDIVESKSAANIENAFFNAKAYTPIDNLISVAEDVSRETIVNSSNYITTDESLAKHYLSNNIQLENMEFFAVLKVAKEFNVPVAGAFIVTNYCNAKAHQSFLDNHTEAMMRLTSYIKSPVKKG